MSINNEYFWIILIGSTSKSVTLKSNCDVKNVFVFIKNNQISNI